MRKNDARSIAKNKSLIVFCMIINQLIGKMKENNHDENKKTSRKHRYLKLTTKRIYRGFVPT